jgi:hypothetical protein
MGPAVIVVSGAVRAAAEPAKPRSKRAVNAASRAKHAMGAILLEANDEHGHHSM